MMTLSTQSPVARDRAGLRSMARQLLAAVFLLSYRSRPASARRRTLRRCTSTGSSTAAMTRRLKCRCR